MRYSVVVGNIGTVWSGDERETAEAYFTDYALQSRTLEGRAGGESVVLFCDDSILREQSAKERRSIDPFFTE